MAQLIPLPLTVSCFGKIELPFWYRLTRLVPEKGPLNGCVVCVGGVWVPLIYFLGVQEMDSRVSVATKTTRCGYFVALFSFLLMVITVLLTSAAYKPTTVVDLDL